MNSTCTKRPSEFSVLAEIEFCCYFTFNTIVRLRYLRQLSCVVLFGEDQDRASADFLSNFISNAQTIRLMIFASFSKGEKCGYFNCSFIEMRHLCTPEPIQYHTLHIYIYIVFDTFLHIGWFKVLF